MAKKQRTLEERTEYNIKKLTDAKIAKKKKKRNHVPKAAQREKINNLNKKKRAKNLLEKHKQFLRSYEGNAGNLYLACKEAGTTTKWFYYEIATHELFQEAYEEINEQFHAEIKNALYLKAKQGDVNAIREWQYKFNRAYMSLQQRYMGLLSGALENEVIDLTKKAHLQKSVKRLEEMYAVCMVSGKFDHAIKAQSEIIKLLQLAEESVATDYDVLTGSQLLTIMEGIGFKPQVEDIHFEEVPDNVKSLYKDMFPTLLGHGTEENV